MSARQAGDPSAKRGSSAFRLWPGGNKGEKVPSSPASPNTEVDVGQQVASAMKTTGAMATDAAKATMDACANVGSSFAAAMQVATTPLELGEKQLKAAMPGMFTRYDPEKMKAAIANAKNVGVDAGKIAAAEKAAAMQAAKEKAEVAKLLEEAEAEFGGAEDKNFVIEAEKDQAATKVQAIARGSQSRRGIAPSSPTKRAAAAKPPSRAAPVAGERRQDPASRESARRRRTRQPHEPEQQPLLAPGQPPPHAAPPSSVHPASTNSGVVYTTQRSQLAGLGHVPPVAPVAPAARAAAVLPAAEKKSAPTVSPPKKKLTDEEYAKSANDREEAILARAKLFKIGQEYYHSDYGVEHGKGVVTEIDANHVVHVTFGDGFSHNFTPIEQRKLRPCILEADKYEADTLFDLVDADASGTLDKEEFQFLHAMLCMALKSHEDTKDEVEKQKELRVKHSRALNEKLKQARRWLCGAAVMIVLLFFGMGLMMCIIVEAFKDQRPSITKSGGHALADNSGYILETSPALTPLPLLVAPVMPWGLLSKVGSLTVSYYDPKDTEDPPQKTKASVSVANVVLKNATAVSFQGVTGHRVKGVKVWNGDALVVFDDGATAQACESNVSCSALMVSDGEHADEYIQDAYDALRAGGFSDKVNEGETGLRRLQDSCQQPDAAAPSPPPPVSQTSALWTAFTEAKSVDDLTTSPIVDFSYAGYAHGERGIPLADGPRFDVTQYGAVPDDDIDDEDAVHAAIDAAHAEPSCKDEAPEPQTCIVFFPPGRYLVSEKLDVKETYGIYGANIIIKGSGSGGATETTLFAKHTPSVDAPGDLYNWGQSTDALFKFERKGWKSKAISSVAADARQGSFLIKVNSTCDAKNRNCIYPGDQILIGNGAKPDIDANSALLGGRTPLDEWKLNDDGIKIREKHEVAELIDETTIRLVEPLMCNITAAHGWTVALDGLTRGWGVEDLHLIGGWEEDEFKHHNNWVSDLGWKMISFTGGLNPYVRRVRISNVTGTPVEFEASMGATCILTAIEGPRGHSSFKSKMFSFGTLFAFTSDNNQFHGHAVAVGAVGTVITNSKISDRGLDWHGVLTATRTYESDLPPLTQCARSRPDRITRTPR